MAPATGENRMWVHIPFNSEAYLATCVSCAVRVVRTTECGHKLMFTELPLRCPIQG